MRNLHCEVMVQSVGADSFFHPQKPVHFRVAGVLTGRVERWAPEKEGREGVIRSAEVRFPNGTVFVPTQSILDGTGALFPIEDIVTRCECGHSPEKHIECIDFTSATGCVLDGCECDRYTEY